MIRHVVLLRWNEGVTESDVKAVSDALAALPGQIPEIRAYQFGPDLRVDEGNADYAVVGDFESTDDFRTYQGHPAHVALGRGVMGPIVASFQSAQFELP